MAPIIFSHDSDYHDSHKTGKGFQKGISRCLDLWEAGWHMGLIGDIKDELASQEGKFGQ